MATEADGFVQTVAETLGASPSAIRLLISLFAGYPLACIHRSVLHGRSSNLHHLYFTICGLVLCYFNFGLNVIHSVINILVIYVLLQTAGGTQFSVAFSYIFNTTYLLIGYYTTSTEGYDIRWTMPHCVLVLRLTAVAIDLCDGNKSQESLTAEQKETALHKAPSLLEMCGQVYFYGGFLIGPQFSLKRYLSFTEGKYLDPHCKGPPDSIGPGLQRMILGVFFIAVHQIGGIFFPEDYLITENFQMFVYNYLGKTPTVQVYWHMANYRLITGMRLGLSVLADVGTIRNMGVVVLFGLASMSLCHIFSEGACTVTGISYNGRDVNGNNLWDGVVNVNLTRYEKCIYYHDLVRCFNYNTNMWMAKYLFKRLRFFGNKMVSQGVTLVYLSLWHGIHSGYHMNFFLEFIMMNGEAQMFSLVNKVPSLQKINSLPTLQPVLWLLKKLYFQFCLSYALVAFGLLTWKKYMQVYSSLFYAVHVFYFMWPLVDAVATKLLVSSKTSKYSESSSPKSRTDSKPLKAD